MVVDSSTSASYTSHRNFSNVVWTTCGTPFSESSLKIKVLGGGRAARDAGSVRCVTAAVPPRRLESDLLGALLTVLGAMVPEEGVRRVGLGTAPADGVRRLGGADPIILVDLVLPLIQ